MRSVGRRAERRHRDSAAWEGSFSRAKGALSLTDAAIRKAGDQARAIAVFKEGRAAGADRWLFMSSVGRAADQQTD
jgi:hypothetical protein